MRILVFGSGGQLGHELMRQSRQRYPDTLGVDYPEADITVIERVAAVFRDFQPALAVNAAAYTNVDGAESEPQLAESINRDGPANIARLCAQYRIPLIHVSTDYVFDGSKGRPYRETDPVSPTGVYGHTKAAGETALRSILNDHIILRTAWLYSSHGQNFVKTILKLARQKEKIRVVSDQWGCPTSAADLADAILTVSTAFRAGKAINWGTYHYCGRGITTWHEFAEEIVQLGRQYERKLTDRIEAIKSADYPTLAARPPYSALNCDLLLKNFGIPTQPWRDSLKITIGELYQRARD